MKPSVCFVPGMFSPFINGVLGVYFVDQMAYLEQRGVEYEVAPIHTEGLVGPNSQAIRDLLMAKEDGSVILFGHSKGGVDSLDCLIRYPETHRKIKKAIFMQSPLLGTPLADFALGGDLRRSMTWMGFQLMRGDIRSAEELTTQHRRAYVAEHAAEIKAIGRHLNIQCVGSSKSPEPGRFDSILKITRDLMHGWGLPNDGMVPLANTKIDGLAHEAIRELDHASAVIRMTPQFYDRRSFSNRLFGEALA